MVTLLKEYKNPKTSVYAVERKRERNGDSRFQELCCNRFRDLCCSRRGELVLEQLFESVEDETETRIVIGAIRSLQSLLVLGMQYGAKAGSLAMERKGISDSKDCSDYEHLAEWDASCAQKLKSECNRLPGMDLLAVMKRKRSPQGAYDVLVRLGIWLPDEDLSLLRSGFPLRFNEGEINAAAKVILSSLHTLPQEP